MKSASLFRRLFRHIRGRILSGLLILIPVIITFFALRLFFDLILFLISPLSDVPIGGLPRWIVTVLATGMLVGLIYALGALTARMFGRKLVSLLERVILHVPIAKSVYGASKQALEALRLSNRKAFKAVVVVEYPQPDCYCLAFVAAELTDSNGRPLVSVFLPTTPNPTSGLLLVLTENKVAYTDLTVEEGIKMIISGGLLAPSKLTLPVSKQTGPFS